jgi:hypothetical protein
MLVDATKCGLMADILKRLRGHFEQIYTAHVITSSSIPKPDSDFYHLLLSVYAPYSTRLGCARPLQIYRWYTRPSNQRPGEVAPFERAKGTTHVYAVVVLVLTFALLRHEKENNRHSGH